MSIEPPPLALVRVPASLPRPDMHGGAHNVPVQCGLLKSGMDPPSQIQAAPPFPPPQTFFEWCEK